MNHEAEESHLLPVRVYFIVWAALIVGTVITVGACYADLGHLAVFTALLIATAKAGLVMLYFMHLRYEKPLFAVMILVLLATYGIYIMLTFADYVYR
ncbi:MAG: cytochrome-c oxidase [Armatimonadia bacterium]|nr:cytochrome-c oxidase [Armatimonadia bacterium]